jgi:hypothetical protein
MVRRMPEQWYDVVEATAGLLQGDLIFKCPILDWKPTPIQIQGEAELEQLKASVEILVADVIVLTQACDLEQKSVDDVVVCPHYSLPDIKSTWEEKFRTKGQNPTVKAWKDFCDDVRKGFVWNYAMLNHGEVAGTKIEHRVVDFHDIHTIPLVFLQGIATIRGERFRLRPPYREHLSQAFARYFMRVGLPSNVDTVW